MWVVGGGKAEGMKGNTEEIQVFDVNTWVRKYLEKGNMRSRGRLVFFPLGGVCVRACACTCKGLLITSFGHARLEIL